VKPTLLRFTRLVSLALIAALAGFYASILLRSEPASAPMSAPAPDAPAAKSAETTLTLPEFVLNDLAGQPRSIAEFTGQPLLINFWATWCAPCLREMPMFETVWQERRADRSLQFVGIAVDRTEDVAPYLEQTGVTYPILVGQSDAMDAAASFGPDFAGLPFTVFVSTDRQILLTHSGELLREQLDDILSVVDAVAADRMSVVDARARLNR